MKLYFTPRTRATRARWILEELGVPYELVRLDPSKQENKTPEFLAVNPFGEVPALVDGDMKMYESLAICLYLADRFPEKGLAPPLNSPERGPYLNWVIFAETKLEPAVLPFFWHAQLPEEKKSSPQAQEELAKHRARLNDVLAVIEAAVDGRDFLVGGRFTAADLVNASILHLANTLKLLEGRTRLFEYCHKHCQGPAVRRAVS